MSSVVANSGVDQAPNLDSNHSSSDSVENLRRFRSCEIESYSGSKHAANGTNDDDDDDGDTGSNKQAADKEFPSEYSSGSSRSSDPSDHTTDNDSSANTSGLESVPDGSTLLKRSGASSKDNNWESKVSKSTVTTTTISESIESAEATITKEKVVTTATNAATTGKTTTKVKLKRRPRFADLKFQPNTTILEGEASKTSIFAGFYTLFWLGTFVMFVKTILVNYRNTGYILQTHIFSILWRDLPKIAFTDLFLFLLTFTHVAVQKQVANHTLSWNGSASLLISIYEAAFLAFALWWPIRCDYPWIGRVFLCLHSLVLLMKQHSYSFFCGHLSVVRDNLMLFESALRGLRKEAPPDGTLSDSQLEQESKLLDEIEFCHVELKSNVGYQTNYPDNVTFYNFFDYMMLPTVVYEVEYPRTDKIRWSYLFEKIAAIFGVFFLMILIAEQYFYPIVMRALSLRELTFIDKVYEYPFLLLDLILPFMLMYLLTWYLIWDAILNAIAELTFFADRRFYGPWWNCVQWDQFAREWNVPVHLFLLRHVYHSSISALHVSKHAATCMHFLFLNAF